MARADAGARVGAGRGIARLWGAAAALAGLAAAFGPGTAGTARAEDPAPEWRTYAKGLEAQAIEGLRTHPKSPDALYAFVHGLGIARSVDGGARWTAMHEGIDPKDLPGPRDACTLTLDPRDPKTLYVCTKGTIYRSENEGRSWTAISSQALASWSLDRRRSAMRIAGLAVDPGKSVHLLAGTRAGEGFHGGLFESQDGGKRWNQLAGSNMPESGLGRDAWPIGLDSKTDKHILAGGEEGLWLSEDRGTHFKAIELGESAGPHDIRDLSEVVQKEVFAADSRGVWWSRDGGKKWGKGPVIAGDAVAVQVDPTNRKRVFAVLRDRGLFLTEDARRQEWNAKVTFADLEIRGLAHHPRDRDVVYAASPATGLHVSRDRGASFVPVTADIPATVPAMAVVAGHPGGPGRFLAASAEGVVYASADHGQTWERVGRLGMAPTALRPDPSSADMWWAAGSRLLVSRDGGRDWERLYVPEALDDRIVEFHRGPDGTLRLLLERARTVVTSGDGGKTWQEGSAAGSSERTALAAGLAVDPKDGKHLLMALRTRTLPWNPKDEEGGPYESWDGGLTWLKLSEGLFKKDEPRKQWNFGRLVGIDPATGCLYYGADGAGFFVRRAEAPGAGGKPGGDKKAAPEAAWAAVPDGGVPTPTIHAFLLRPTEDGTDSEVLLQVEGEDDARAVLSARGSGLAALLTPPAAGAERPRPWDGGRVKDPGARLVGLTADPGNPGRLLAADLYGERGILVMEPTGAAPAAPGAGPEAPPKETPVVPEAPPGPTAEPAPPPAGLVGITVGTDKQMRVIDLAARTVSAPLAAHDAEAYVLVRLPDGRLASAGADRTVRLWNGPEGAPQAVLGPAEHGASVTSLAPSPDGKVLYAGCRENWALVRWDLAARTAQRLEGHAGAVLALALTPDGSRLYSAGEDARILVWDTATNARVPAEGYAFPGEVHALAMSGDGSRLYAAGHVPGVRAFRTTDGAEAAVGDLSPAKDLHALVLSPDGATLYVGGDAGLWALKADDLTVRARYVGPAKGVHALAVSADGAWLLAGDGGGAAWLFDVAVPGKPAWTGPVHDGAVRGVLFRAPPAPPGGP